MRSSRSNPFADDELAQYGSDRELGVLAAVDEPIIDTLKIGIERMARPVCKLC